MLDKECSEGLYGVQTAYSLKNERPTGKDAVPVSPKSRLPYVNGAGDDWLPGASATDPESYQGDF